MADVFVEIGQVVITSLVSLVGMFLLTRWGGKRQISQMSPFDYLNAVTTGSIAAELATDLEQWYRPVTAMVVYGLVTWVVHFTACRSIFMRSLWSGRSLVLMESGTIFKENLSSCTAWASGRKARYFTRAATSRAHSSPAAAGKEKGRSPKLRPFCIERCGPDYLK